MKKTPNRFKNSFGQALIAEEVLSDDQLERVIDLQKEKLKKYGDATLFGMLVVELGYASEADIVKALNGHFDIPVTSLADNIEEMIRRRSGSVFHKIKMPRIPIWLHLSITTTLTLITVILILSFVLLDRQKENLYAQTTKIGTVSLNYFANNSRIPLINKNILELNILINEASSVDGIIYALIIDNDNEIIAHTDHKMMSQEFEEIDNKNQLTSHGDISSFNYTLDTGEQILNLSRPIIFKNKQLGQVQVGVSIDFIETIIKKEQQYITYLALFIILFGIVIAVTLGLQFSRPLSRLVSATKRIAAGSYRHKVYLRRNDELGELALAFNEMGEELWLKGLMQNSFGKYVGSDVLQMIIDNPNELWLAGKRSQAAVVFTDIRGFTAYCETTEPEKVVEHLNQYFSIATEVILEHGGYVDKFIGDAVLGVFGVPVYYEDYIERAVRASIVMQERLNSAYLETVARGDENKFLNTIGIGINAGGLVSGNIGSQDKMEYTVIGDTVNVAARLNSLAGDAETIVSEDIKEKLGNLITTEALPPCELKGKSEPIQTFKVLQIKGKV